MASKYSFSAVRYAQHIGVFHSWVVLVSKPVPRVLDGNAVMSEAVRPSLCHRRCGSISHLWTLLCPQQASTVQDVRE